MKSHKVTMRDVAKALGLSVSTVSKALSDNHEIGAATKAKVLEFVVEQNYTPNPIARSLKYGESKSIGVVLPTVDNHFFCKVIDGIESVAHQHGYHIIISQSHESFEREVLNIKNLTSRAIDGLLISPSTETTDYSCLRKLQQQGLKVVVFDRITQEIETDQIATNNYEAAYQATNHLIECGFKNIAHIGCAANVFIAQERLKGYKKALAEHGQIVNPMYIKYCQHGGMTVEEVETVLDDLLQMEPCPDAIFTASDRITTKTFFYLNNRAIQIPNEIGLIGFSNTQLAKVISPSLSRIKQPAFEMGQIAMTKLMNLIRRKNFVQEYQTVILENTLELNRSTR